MLPFLLAAALAFASELPSFHSWRLQDGRFEGGGDAPMAVGSLQKPFVAKAWAESHPRQPPPRFTCPRGPGCWVRSGHGELDLVRALAVSCNAYFRSLASATPMERLRATFAEEGFAGAPASPDNAIGLYNGELPPVIQPSKLLEAYVRLVDRPWTSGEEIRQQVLAGLREAAWSGTAGRIGAQGCWAKTGTIAVDPLRTCGLALIVDVSGRAVLGRLEPGSGREAAERLAASLTQRGPTSAGEPGPAVPDQVRVRILELLRGRRIQVRNAGPAPIPAAQGFIGSGTRADLAAGLWVGPGLLELTESRSGLTRRVRGRIECRRGPDGRLAVFLLSPLREYVGGVIAAELPAPADSRRVELGAAILRFLARGPRHPDADVCDSTHCAWFVGLGPHPSWPQPDLSRTPVGDVPGIEPREWGEMRARSRSPGPSQWTSHCGGRPLSPHALWGRGDTAAPACQRHHAGQSRPWRRTWTRSEVEKAFGGPVENLNVVHEGGKWMLRLSGPAETRQLGYDEAHRRIARILGWGALPSPAEEILPAKDGFHLRGVGLGHRVGLCLGD